MDSIIPQDEAKRIPNTSGIYKIVNLINQHFYVGSAVNLLRRKRKHFSELKAQSHTNDHLQNAYNLYGANAFVFIVIEHVEHPENLLEREQHYIDLMKPHYNICRIAGSTLGVPTTPETKAKVSAALKNRKLSSEHIKKISTARKGQKLSSEHRLKLRDSKLGKPCNPKTKAKTKATWATKRKAATTQKLDQQGLSQPPLF